MKIFNILFIGTLFFTLSAFDNPEKNITDLTGTYSICSVKNYPLSLTLNQDKSFSYRDLTNPNKLIDIKGVWTFDKNTVMLVDTKGSTNFHNKLKLNKMNNGIQSRKGISFYSLSKLANCK